MQYSRVFIDAIGYELAPVVVSSEELECRLAPLYERLRMPPGQLESLTGIMERRWWETGYPIAQGATLAAKKALVLADIPPSRIDTLIYAGVCREQFEPATACRVAAALGISPDAAVYDLSNACLGVLNGILDVANRIELGQIHAGLIVSCESAREINEIVISRLVAQGDMDMFRNSLATLTGGSGAVAVLVTDGSFNKSQRRQLVGGVTQAAPEYHSLCRWGLDQTPSQSTSDADLAEKIEEVLVQTLHQKLRAVLPAGVAPKVEGLILAALKQNLEGILPSVVKSRIERYLPATFTQFMTTDSISVLKYGVALGLRTWQAFLRKLGWMKENVDKVICHQVGAGHRDAILKTLDIPEVKDFSTYPFLGNMGTVSLPLTAALAEEREFLVTGNRVGFLGIGSGLNCLMLGLNW
ncbi:MAG: hypothetical protein KatS3mg105_0677 [Gemmatales bacterium]|nr:MAG: hypothetical protein KatS3mg105_0677 [Gemmatales bacterium]